MDINLLKYVQKRVTQNVHGLRNLLIRDGLKRLNLHSLERRNVRGDLTEVLKWMKGFNNGGVNRVLVVKEQSRTRSNEFKIDQFGFLNDIDKNWITNKMVDR